MNMREYDRERSECFSLEGFNVECFLYTNNSGKVCASGYTGKKKRASFKYSFGSVEQATDYINSFIGRVTANENSDKERKAKEKLEKETAFKETKIGDIYVCSWGYEQTQVDAYQVVAKKGKATLVLQEICTAVVEGSEGRDCQNVVPVKDSFLKDSESFEKRLNYYGITMNSYSSAYKWDGVSNFHNSWYY